MGEVVNSHDYASLYERYCEYLQKHGEVPKTTSDFVHPNLVTYYSDIVLASNPAYSKWTSRYPNMFFIDKRPQRTILPFPFGVWMSYGIPYVPDTRAHFDSETGYRRINSDWQARTLAAAISEQEGGDYNLALSFIPDAIIYAILIALIVIYWRRQRAKARQEETTFERISRFRDAALAYRAKTGRFPANLEELALGDASEYRDAIRGREFLYFAPYAMGVVAATRPWRAPFSLFGKRKTYALYEDGSLIVLQGYAARYLDDLGAALSKIEKPDEFHLSKDELEFQMEKRRATRIKLVAGLVAFVLLLPVVALETYQFGMLLRSMFVATPPRDFLGFPLLLFSCFLYSFFVFILSGGAFLPPSFYEFLAHNVWGVI